MIPPQAKTPIYSPIKSNSWDERGNNSMPYMKKSTFLLLTCFLFLILGVYKQKWSG